MPISSKYNDNDDRHGKKLATKLKVSKNEYNAIASNKIQNNRLKLATQRETDQHYADLCNLKTAMQEFRKRANHNQEVAHYTDTNFRNRKVKFLLELTVSGFLIFYLIMRY